MNRLYDQICCKCVHFDGNRFCDVLDSTIEIVADKLSNQIETEIDAIILKNLMNSLPVFNDVDKKELEVDFKKELEVDFKKNQPPKKIDKRCPYFLEHVIFQSATIYNENEKVNEKEKEKEKEKENEKVKNNEDKNRVCK